jgi:glycosyltransferase involved in cell wall biosynthesis
MKVSIFNGAGQVDYLYGLVSGLAQFKEDQINVLDADVTGDLFLQYPNVRYIPVFRFLPKNSSFFSKGLNIVRFYFRQIWYLLTSSPGIVHFQWLDRYKLIDRLILPTIARMMGNKVVLTVHNINAGSRDNKDSKINRLTLKYLYRISNHLIVHTPLSKSELITEFGTQDSKISVVRHGLNNRVSHKGLKPREGRELLGIRDNEKTVLFFGNIDHYKGLDILIKCLDFLPDNIINNFRLLIAGNSKDENYTGKILSDISDSTHSQLINYRICYIPDEDVEQYFTAADCIVLPYRKIYQSGVIFMAYTFGLPIIVTDIGNFKNDMLEGKTGMIIKENTPEMLSKTITDFFSSEMYLKLSETRGFIKKWAIENYGWESIGKETRNCYQKLFK